MLTIKLVLLCVSSLVISLPAVAQQPMKIAAEVGSTQPAIWRFQRVVDKSTNKLACRLDSPSGKLVLSFLTIPKLRAAGVLTNNLMALGTGATLTVHVDKNPAMEMSVRNDTPGTGAIGYGSELDELFKQMGNGKLLFARLASTTGTEEENFPLTNFAVAFKAYCECSDAVY